jgi:D-alanyl-D-alanine dipeptidase
MPDPLPLAGVIVSGLPVHDRGEPLVDVRTVVALRVDQRLARSNPSHAWLRTTVVDRLVLAQSLLPRDRRLLIVEGYRSAAAQQRHFRECQEELRFGHPDWTDDQILREAAWHCAPAGSAPHPTGAAVDVTLCTPLGIELEMGCPVHSGPVRSQGTCATESGNLSDQAVENRRTLGTVLTAAGLVNLPTAWWHWSYGDRYWCHRTGATAAPYGPLSL